MQDDEVLATISASALRRIFGVAMLMALGVLLLYIAFLRPPDGLGWQLFLAGLGAGAFWLAEKMRRATLLRLELTRNHLRDSRGEVIADLDQITGVERGAFAFKPSNGFVLHLSAPGRRDWQPGLWWRFGRKVGVGGVAPASQTKAMSDLIAMRIAER